MLEFCYKNDALGDPMVNDDHITAMGWASAEQVAEIRRLTEAVNQQLKAIFQKANLQLVDCKLEFGLCGNQVILADEISPDTCRLWDNQTGKKLDKDRFRLDLGEVEEAYLEVQQRLQRILD